MNELNVSEFAEALASSQPVPGGGSAAALIGALGASLCSMAANLTIGKKKYADVEDEMRRIVRETELIRLRQLELVEEDAKFFEVLAKAYSKPKTDPDWAEYMYSVSMKACDAPFEIMLRACDTIELLEIMADKGSRMLLSDVGCGARACKSAMQSAALNIFVNTRGFRGKSNADTLERKTFELLKEYCSRADVVADKVNQWLGVVDNNQKLLKGTAVAERITMDMASRVNALKKHGTEPVLAIVRVGEEESAAAYERNIVKRCEKVGICARKTVLPEEVSQEELISVVRGINNDPSIHGCIIFRPLPAHLDERAVCEALDPAKDVDCITSASLNGIFTGDDVGYPPCTAEACIELLKHYGIPLSGKKVCVIGRSLVIGRPVSMMLQAENATVTMCHSKTVHMDDICKDADILVVAAGKAELVDERFVNRDQVIVDVGIHTKDDGSLCGDVKFANVVGKVKAISPVPGGVGAVTTAVLAAHVVDAAEKAADKNKL